MFSSAAHKIKDEKPAWFNQDNNLLVRCAE
jgi:hypothetical protein